MMKVGDKAYTVSQNKDGGIKEVIRWTVDGYIDLAGFKLVSDFGATTFSNWTSTYNKNGIRELIDDEISSLERRINELKQMKEGL